MAPRTNVEYEWKMRKATDLTRLTRMHKTAHSALLIGRFIYIFGGQDHVHIPAEQKWLILDVVRQKWTSLRVSRSVRGLFRSAHTATLVDDKIILIGGYGSNADGLPVFTNGRSDTSVLVSFDVVLNETKMLPTVGVSPGLLAYHIAEFIPVRGTIVVYGGDVAEPIIPPPHHLYEFVPATATWIPLEWKGIAPPVRSNHASVVLMSDLYIFGGITDGEVYGDLHILSCERQVPTWSTPNVSGALPCARFSPILVAVNNRLLMFGGRVGLPGDRVNDVHEYNPNTKDWSVIEPRGKTPPAKSNHKAVVYGNSVLIFGGMESPLRNVEELRPVRRR